MRGSDVTSVARWQINEPTGTSKEEVCGTVSIALLSIKIDIVNTRI